MNVDELTDYFREVINHAPFETNDTQFNLFEIAGFRHYEEVVSNCYSFFFQTDNPHGLKSLFLEALTELINEKGVEAPLFMAGRCFCERERITEKGKFIDLLLYDELVDEKGKTFRNAIVIENKMYAGLYNDLKHYLDDIPVDSEGSKVGVVLSLNRIPDSQTAPFVSITHSELIARIQQKIGTYLFTANEKYLILLKEFLANLSYLSSPTRMDERVKFYFQNAAKINELVNLHNTVESQIVNATKKEVGQLGFYFSRGNSTAIAMRHEVYPDLATYVNVGNLLSQQSYAIDTWVTDSKIPLWQALDEPALTFLGADNESQISVRKPGSGKKWGLAARAEIKLPKEYKSVEEAPRLIFGYMQAYWMPLLAKLNTLLTNVKA